jgi:hypothetical protein
MRDHAAATDAKLDAFGAKLDARWRPRARLSRESDTQISRDLREEREREREREREKEKERERQIERRERRRERRHDSRRNGAATEPRVLPPAPHGAVREQPVLTSQRNQATLTVSRAKWERIRIARIANA